MAGENAAANAIRLPVIIDFADAKAKLREFKQVAGAEAKAAAQNVQQGMQGVERAAGGAARSMGGLKESVRGVGPAVASVTQAFSLMGTKASPAVQGLTAAIGGLLTGGIGALGFALAGASGLIALLGATSSASDEAGKSFISTTENVKALAKSIEDASLTLRAMRLGMGEDGADILGAMGEQAKRLQASTAARTGGATENRVAEALRLAGFSGTAQALDLFRMFRWNKAEGAVNEQERFISDLKRLAKLRDEINAKKAHEARLDADAEARNARIWAKEAEHDREVQNAREAAISASMRGSALGGAIDSMSLGGAMLTPEQLAEMQQKAVDAQGRSLAGRTESDVAGILDAQRYQPFQYRAPSVGAAAGPISSARTAEINSELAAIDAIRNASMGRFKADVEGAVVSGISDALVDPENWQSALEQFARGLQRAIADYAARGLAEALLGSGGQGNFGAGGLLGSIASGIFSSGIKGTSSMNAATQTEITSIYGADSTFNPGTYSGDPAIDLGGRNYKSAPAGDTFLAVIVADEGQADQLVGKASSAGARAFVAKSQGNGMSAGSIPARRR